MQPRLNPVRFSTLQAVASTFSGAAVRVAQPSGRTTRRSVVVRAEGSELAKVNTAENIRAGEEELASIGSGRRALAAPAQPFHGWREAASGSAGVRCRKPGCCAHVCPLSCLPPG